MKMNEFERVEIALKNFHKSMADLKDLDVLINKKDFTCQIGEWLVASLYDGERSTNGIQKDWDIKVGEKNVQVKTHAKASTNSASWTAVKNDVNADVDELIIVVFYEDYKLKAFYKLPWQIALRKNKRSGGREVINWRDIEEFKIAKENLPKQQLVKLFI